ncbi:hypothetical protein A2U01_0059510, partial [Trifolium medium]|nr:hypothetical protein [Trifolium medium]
MVVMMNNNSNNNNHVLRGAASITSATLFGWKTVPKSAVTK